MHPSQLSVNRSSWKFAQIILAGAFCCGLLTLFPSGTAGIERPEISSRAQQIPTLRQELEFGLRARFDRERDFIDRVVVLVKTGELPLSVVLSTFQWARQKNVSFPFPHFERGLTLRARRLGVTI